MFLQIYICADLEICDCRDDFILRSISFRTEAMLFQQLLHRRPLVLRISMHQKTLQEQGGSFNGWEGEECLMKKSDLWTNSFAIQGAERLS